MGCLGIEVVIVATRLCLFGAEQTSEQSVVVRCPPLVEYSKVEQARAARDLGRLGPVSAASQMILHYGRLRKQCRVIESK